MSNECKAAIMYALENIDKVPAKDLAEFIIKPHAAEINAEYEEYLKGILDPRD